jgi:hypothetical protein
MKGFQIRLVLLFALGAGALLFLQNAFDSSDHRKGEKAVRTYTVGERQLGPYLEQREPGGTWSTEITQGCRGVVRTRYRTAQKLYEFDYDVPSHAIHPGNELGRELLQAFTGGTTTVSDGGVPHD